MVDLPFRYRKQEVVLGKSVEENEYPHLFLKSDVGHVKFGDIQ